jgi:hypothetical protein
MAMQGASRDDIQVTLDHDSPASAQAYIDAAGSDLIPVIERADRGLGEIFSNLREAFFRGFISNHIGRKPIRIPVNVSTPALVGSCGSNTACKKHPFWSCYDGCPQFLAWREADHQQALNFVRSEFKRWNEAEDGRERSKAMKDFDRMATAIGEVIQQVTNTDSTKSE